VSDLPQYRSPLTTNAAAGRGERLNPPASSRVYWHLTGLRLEMEKVVERYLSTERSGTLVDFGCGNMPYRSLFADRVADYIGCDLPGNELADSVMDGPCILPIDKGSACIVLSSQVLEHVEDPPLYLREAHRALSDAGLLILSTHGVWRYHPDPYDLWRWTSDGLRRTIEKHGFSVLHFAGVMGPEATALQLWQDAVLDRWPTIVRPIFTWCMQRWIMWADSRCDETARARDACVYVIVARKNT
jgi:SAM-dependent methyltransferase